MKKILFIVRGLPGAGKTTAAAVLASDHWPVLSADDYFYGDDGSYNFDPEQLGQAHLECNKQAEYHMWKGTKQIFIANTFTTEAEVNAYVQLADAYNYDVVSMVIESRHSGKNIHNVPENTIKKMRDRFEIKL